MHTLYAGVHIKNKLSDVHPLHNIDLEQNVAYLKEVITKELQLQFGANELEICYHGKVLNDLQLLNSIVKPNAMIHCFHRTKLYQPYDPPAASEINTKHIQELFSLTSHLQISVTSRVNILQKILAEYPEFRRNLGAQALIRDSVLFNTLHEPEVVQNLVREYPLICDAASFIVDTIRKELARNSSATHTQELAASESTTSSEEENSLGAGSSSSGGSSANVVSRRDELANIRQISRQQLANALARVDMGSVNSLSNIAQRNADEAQHEDPSRSVSAAATASNSSGTGSARTERSTISSDLLRSELVRAFQSLHNNTSAGASATAPERMDEGVLDQVAAEPMQYLQDNVPIDYDEDLATNDDSDVLPLCYRRHRFAEQLRTMAAMGFINHLQNCNFLNMTDGNVEQAINLLMLEMN